MRIILASIIFMATFFLASEIRGQDKTRDARAVKMIKTLQVSSLDKRLSAGSFSQWIGQVVGESQKIE